MLSGHFKDVKTTLMRLGKLEPELETQMKRCIRQLSQATEYEKLFSNAPKALVDLQTGVSQNSRDIITICINRTNNKLAPLTTSDFNLINQKLDDNDRLLKDFDDQIKQVLK